MIEDKNSLAKKFHKELFAVFVSFCVKGERMKKINDVLRLMIAELAIMMNLGTTLLIVLILKLYLQRMVNVFVMERTK